MKYELLKDLPSYPAGTVFDRTSKGGYYALEIEGGKIPDFDSEFILNHDSEGEGFIKMHESLPEPTPAVTTYDSVSLGWEDGQHYRMIMAIEDGKIVKSARVSDDLLRSSKHGRVITQYHIQEYGQEYLKVES